MTLPRRQGDLLAPLKIQLDVCARENGVGIKDKKFERRITSHHFESVYKQD